MKRAREAYPDKYAAAVARKRARRGQPTVQAIVQKELRKNTDWKFTDNTASGSVSSTGTVLSLLANLVRGDAGLNEFSGNDIRPSGVLFKYYLQTNQTYNSVRVMVFQWMDSATPVPSGILQNTATNIATISATLVTNKKYIRVLHDRTHVFSPSAGGDTTPIGLGTVPCQTVYIPGKRLRPVRYNSSTNTVQDGNIYVLTISDDLVTSFPQLYWYSRVTFSDA